jgi:hypothetical protein
MTKQTTEQKTIKELETKLATACELIKKQQASHNKFKSQYIELINLLERNQNGSFTISNYVEDELLVKGWQLQADVILTGTNPILFALFENSCFLLNSKEYFIITPSNGAKLGNAKGESYNIEILWDKVGDAKKNYLNKTFDLNIPLSKQDDKFVRDEIAEEINQFLYNMTGATIEY